jgi:hypothetical protein
MAEIRYAPNGGHSTALDVKREKRHGTALNQHSKVWFTLSHGILNEVYFRASIRPARDMGFIAPPGDFFSEEKRHCTFENRPCEPGSGLSIDQY